MHTAPTLRTDRLRLRALGAADFEAYAAICADPEVMRYIGEGGPVARDVAWRQLALLIGHWSLCGFGMWAVDERDADGRGWHLIGRVGFLQPEGWPGCELAWTLARAAWGKGYAFEAASAAREIGRDHFGLRELISLIRPDNQRSIALARRLGAGGEQPIDFMGGTALLFRHPPQ